MKLDLTHNSTAKIALVVIAIYAIIATITYLAWN
jgi:hypothetical protein